MSLMHHLWRMTKSGEKRVGDKFSRYKFLSFRRDIEMKILRKMLSYMLERMPENELAHLWLQSPTGAFPGGSVVKNLLANVGEARDVGSSPGLWRCPGEGNGNRLRYSCLGNLVTEEPGGLQSKESDKAEHACTHKDYYDHKNKTGTLLQRLRYIRAGGTLDQTQLGC